MSLWQTEITCINYSSGINSPKDGKQNKKIESRSNVIQKAWCEHVTHIMKGNVSLARI